VTKLHAAFYEAEAIHGGWSVHQQPTDCTPGAAAQSKRQTAALAKIISRKMPFRAGQTAIPTCWNLNLKDEYSGRS
jgi:hypothetical protein